MPSHGRPPPTIFKSPGALSKTLSAEDALVRQTTAEYLEQAFGWESVYACNNEDFGLDGLSGRKSYREAVLTRTPRTKIEELNPGLPITAYEESLAVFDLLKRPDLTPGGIRRIKGVAVDLLETLKAEKLRIKHWRDKKSTRDAVRLTIRDYLRSGGTGLPETYSEAEVRDRTEAVFVHVFRACPTVPSPYYAGKAS